MSVSEENIFEIIGVYFANHYWNTLYNEANKEFQDKKFDKRELAYKMTIERYSRAVCPQDETEKINKYYVIMVKNLFKEYKIQLESSETYLGFIDIVSKYLLPKEHYRKLSTNDVRKDTIFRNVLTKTIMLFTIHVSQNELKNILDVNNRKDTKFIINLKNTFINILIKEKNKLCSILLAQNSGVDITQNDDITQIPKEVCDKLKESIKELIKSKAELIKDYNQYVKYVDVLKGVIKERDEEIKKLKKYEKKENIETDKKYEKYEPKRKLIKKEKERKREKEKVKEKEEKIKEKEEEKEEKSKSESESDSENEALEILKTEEYPEKKSEKKSDDEISVY